MNKIKGRNPNSQQYSDEKIIIYESELDYLSKCIIESPQLETGGNLFGLWTPFGIPLVHYVVGPGPKALHDPIHFRQDYEFLDKNADNLVKEHALHHIGSWHSHHSLGLAQPSNGDTESTLSGIRECHLESFILLIGNYRHGKSTVNAFRYYSNGNCIKLKWVILRGESPIRSVYDRCHPDFVYNPHAETNMMRLEESSLIGDQKTSDLSPVFDEHYWLSLPENRKELATIVKFLKKEFEKVSIFQTDNSTVEIKLEKPTEAIKFMFDKTFPKNAPKLFVPKSRESKLKSKPEWKIAGKSISEAFIHYYETIKL